MEPEEKTLINEASIVDLKAELYKKEIEAHQKGIGSTAHVVEHRRSKTLQKIAIMTGKVGNIKKQQVQESKVSIPSTKKLLLNELTEYEQRKLKDSEESLKVKSKLYDKLQEEAKTGNTHTDLADSGVMVDFNKKALDSNKVNTNDQNIEKAPDARKSTKDEIKTKDNELTFFEEVQLAEAEHREKMNLKWEEERERLKEKPLGQEHYQDVFFNELREHGVGYYQFSAKESERSAQLDLLKKLRDQTMDSRKKNTELKMKREQAIKERILKIRKRRGENIEDTPSLNNQVNAIESAQTPPLNVSTTPNSVNQNKPASMEAQIEAIINNSREETIMKELIQKVKVNTPESIEDESRNPKFAPPTNYSVKSKQTRYF